MSPCAQKVEHDSSGPLWQPQITVLASMQKANCGKRLFSCTYTCQAVPGIFVPVSLFPHKRDIGSLVQAQQRAGGENGAVVPGIWAVLKELDLFSLEKTS